MRLYFSKGSIAQRHVSESTNLEPRARSVVLRFDLRLLSCDTGPNTSPYGESVRSADLKKR